MSLSEKIRSLLSKGETQNALTELTDYARSNDRSLYDMAILLQSRYAKNESDRLLGVVSDAETALESNRINLALLQLVARIQSSEQNGSTPPPVPTPRPAPANAIDPAVPISIFVSYSHDDEDLLKELNQQLAPLRRHPALKVWTDNDIIGSQDWDGEIKNNLMNADIVLLLVSPGFLSSEYIYSNELTAAMQRHEQGLASVVPIILRPCDWRNETFARLQGLPKGVKPVVSWTSRDEAFLDVVTGLKKVIIFRQQQKKG